MRSCTRWKSIIATITRVSVFDYCHEMHANPLVPSTPAHYVFCAFEHMKRGKNCSALQPHSPTPNEKTIFNWFSVIRISFRSICWRTTNNEYERHITDQIQHKWIHQGWTAWPNNGNHNRLPHNTMDPKSKLNWFITVENIGINFSFLCDQILDGWRMEHWSYGKWCVGFESLADVIYSIPSFWNFVSI